MEGQTQEASFAAARHPAGDIQEGAGDLATTDDDDLAGLAYDEKTRIARGDRNADRAGQTADDRPQRDADRTGG